MAHQPKTAEPRGSAMMKVHDVAQYLHCHEATIYRLIKKDEFPVIKVRSNLRFRRSDVERWIVERHVKAGQR
jgi:excisionase family DNA binding protein